MAIFKPGYCMPESAQDCHGNYIHETLKTNKPAGLFIVDGYNTETRRDHSSSIDKVEITTRPVMRTYRTSGLCIPNTHPVTPQLACTIFRSEIIFGPFTRAIYYPMVTKADAANAVSSDLWQQVMGVYVMPTDKPYTDLQTEFLKFLPHLSWITPAVRVNLHKRGILGDQNPATFFERLLAKAEFTTHQAYAHTQSNPGMLQDFFVTGKGAALFSIHRQPSRPYINNGLIVHGQDMANLVFTNPGSNSNQLKEDPACIEEAKRNAEKFLDELAFAYCKTFKDPNADRLMDNITWVPIPADAQNNANTMRDKTGEPHDYLLGLSEPWGRLRIAPDITDANVLDHIWLVARGVEGSNLPGKESPRSGFVNTCIAHKYSDKTTRSFAQYATQDSVDWPEPMARFAEDMTGRKKPLYLNSSVVPTKVEQARAKAAYKYAVYSTVLAHMNPAIAKQHLRAVSV